MSNLNRHESIIINQKDDTVYFENIPIFELSCYYVYNILKNIEFFDYKILLLAVKQLKPEQRYDFINFLKENHANPEIARYEPLEKELAIVNILNDIETSLLKLSHHQIKEKLLGYYLCNLKNILGKKIITPELEELKKIFKLSDKEIQIILFIYLMEENYSFEEIIRHLSLKEILRLIVDATDSSKNEIKSILSNESRLVKTGIIEIIGHGSFKYELNESLRYYLAGFDKNGLTGSLYMVYDKSSFDLKSYNLNMMDLEILISIIKSNEKCNILFYGDPGTGKTELSKSLITYCGKRAIFPIHYDRTRWIVKSFAIEAAMGFADKNDVVVIDEADYLLSSENYGLLRLTNYENSNNTKEWANDFLDRSNNQIIWIVNSTRYISKSTLRRFEYSLHFKPFRKKEREIAWNIALKNLNMEGFISKNEISKFSERYPLNMGPISTSLKTLKTIKGNRKISNKKAVKYLDFMLNKQVKLLVGENLNSYISILSIKYDASVINIDIDLDSLIRTLKDFKHLKRKKDYREKYGINLLFYGLPGTGKTEFAKYLSKILNLNLMVYRASDLESMWVGETEKNIKNAFRRAEDENAILLIDEADSFFTDRKSAVRSWEVSRTNEFLTQMENHNIIFIASSNLIENFDAASLRRFYWKVKFNPLTDEGKIKIYKMYFKISGRKFTEKHKNMLIKLKNITPGDIKAVWRRLMYVDNKILSHELIIGEIEKEVEIKMMKEPKKIGLL